MPSLWKTQSYAELPALSVRGLALRRSLRIVTIAWMFGSTWMVAIGGATVLNFGALAGFSDFHWAMLTTIAFAATLAQVPASYLVERTGLRKFMFIHAVTLGRFMWVLIGLVPLLLLWTGGPGLAIWAMFGLSLIGWILGHLGAPAWTTWMGDLIPSRIRGRYFARRNVYAICVQIIVTIALGVLFDRVVPAELRQALRDRQLLAEQLPRLVYVLSAVYIAAGLSGMVDILLFARVRELVRAAPPAPIRLTDVIREPLRDRRFVRYVAGISTTTLGTALAMAFYGPLAQKHLELSNTWLNITLMICGPIGAILSSRLWGRLIDRWGRRPVLLISTAGVALTMWGWLLIPPAEPWRYALSLVTFVSGIAWTGIGMGQFNMLLTFTDHGGRSTFVAASSVIVSLAGVAGSQIGAAIASALEPMRWTVGPFVLIHYHVVIFLSGAVCLLSCLWIAGVDDPGAKPTLTMIRELRTNLYHGMGSMFLLPTRLVGWSGKALYRVGQPPRRE